MLDTKTTAQKITKIQPKPFLKWVGGKGRLLPQLSQLYPDDFNEFYEPFVGGGALFFSLNPKIGHINDTNSKLISAYKHIRDDVNGLIAELRALQKHYHELADIELQKLYFYEIRSKYNSLLASDPENASLLIFLNKTCFNGMYRENSKGGFNVPFGKHVSPTICDESNLRAVSESLQHTTISCSSFEEAVETASKGDFVYFDPPYHPLNATSSFTSYGADDFRVQDQEKLRDIFVKLSKRGCKVMLSNSDTEFIKDLYKDYKIHTILAGRSINSIGSKRGKITEIVVTNY